MMSFRCAEVLFFVYLLCLLCLPNYCDIKQNEGDSQSIQTNKIVPSSPSRIENVPSREEEIQKQNSLGVEISKNESPVQLNIENVNIKIENSKEENKLVEQKENIPNLEASAEIKKPSFADLESSRSSDSNEKEFTISKLKSSSEGLTNEGKARKFPTEKTIEPSEPSSPSYTTSNAKILQSEKVIIESTLSSSSSVPTDASAKKLEHRSSPSPMESVKLFAEESIQQQPQYDGMPSFDEWKKMMLAEQEKGGQKILSPSQPGKKISSQKRRRNYSSYECGAKIVASNSEAEGTSRILNELVDEYMLNPCKTKIWFVIELCETVQASQIELANFELFSSCPKDFVVYSSDNFPTRDWVLLGNFTAVEQRVLQSFELKQEGFGKFVKIELLSHYGKEHYCPLSVVRIFGTSMVDEYEEMETMDNHPDIPDDDLDRLDIPVEDKKVTNIFGSATDAVMNIVKKAAEALGHQPVEENHNDTSAEKGNLSEKKLCKNESDSDSCDQTKKTKDDAIPFHNFTLSSAPVPQSLFRLLHRCDQCASSHIRYYSSAQPHCRFFQAAFGPVMFQALCDWFKDNPLAIAHETPVPGKKPPVSTDFVITPTKSPPPHIIRIPSETDLPVKDVIINDTITSVSDIQETITVNVSTVTIDKLNKTKPSSGKVKLESSIQPTQSTLADRSVAFNDSRDKSVNESQDFTMSPENISDYEIKISTFAADDGTNDMVVTETVTVSITASDFTTIGELTASEEEQINEFLSESGTVSPDDATSAETIAVTEVPSTLKPSEEKQDLRSEYQGRVEPVAMPSGATAGQKESVFMRMSNRIKALEINMSLSGQYLQELSQRYRRQMEEMQRAFNRTVGTLNDTAKKAAERDLKQQEILNNLQLQVSNLSETVQLLLSERSSVFRQMIETHICIMVIEIIVMITIMSLCVRRVRTASQQSAPVERSIASPPRLSKRRSSVDSDTLPIARKVKKRSSSEDNLNADVLIVEPMPVFLDPTLKVKKRNRKRNRGLQRSISHPTVEQKCSSQCTSKHHSHSHGCILANMKKQHSQKASHLCENCNNDSCSAAKTIDKEKRSNGLPLQNLTNGSIINPSASGIKTDNLAKGKEKFSFKKFLKFQKRDSI